MTSKTMIGMLLIALAFVAFAYVGITYTSQNKILDVGPLEISTERSRSISLPPILGAAALVVGIGFLVAGRKKLNQATA